MLFRAKAPLEGGMIRIAITAEAFEAVSVLLPGNVGYEREPTEDGERLIWLEPHVVAKLRYLRGPGESYSDVILKLSNSRRVTSFSLARR
jgi:hypothetical protein